MGREVVEVVKRKYVFEPVGWDIFDARPMQPKPGTVVVKTQPYGTPKNGTMGHCFIKDAETGEFYGLVLEASLQPVETDNRYEDQPALPGTTGVSQEPKREDPLD